jgi:hypothetical protein
MFKTLRLIRSRAALRTALGPGAATFAPFAPFARFGGAGFEHVGDCLFPRRNVGVGDTSHGGARSGFGFVVSLVVLAGCYRTRLGTPRAFPFAGFSLTRRTPPPAATAGPVGPHLVLFAAVFRFGRFRVSSVLAIIFVIERL